MMDEVEEKGNWNMSFTYKMRSGPRIEPWWRPDRTADLEEEQQPSTTTCWDQSVK